MFGGFVCLVLFFLVGGVGVGDRERVLGEGELNFNLIVIDFKDLVYDEMIILFILFNK